jgi:hypothetical protein
MKTLSVEQEKVIIETFNSFIGSDFLKRKNGKPVVTDNTIWRILYTSHSVSNFFDKENEFIDIIKCLTGMQMARDRLNEMIDPYERECFNFIPTLINWIVQLYDHNELERRCRED